MYHKRGTTLWWKQQQEICPKVQNEQEKDKRRVTMFSAFNKSRSPITFRTDLQMARYFRGHPFECKTRLSFTPKTIKLTDSCWSFDFPQFSEVSVYDLVKHRNKPSGSGSRLTRSTCFHRNMALSFFVIIILKCPYYSLDYRPICLIMIITLCCKHYGYCKKNILHM